MQIYFEDGKLINSKLLPIIPNFIINAEDGVTSCINQLDDINSVKPCAIIYTNSIFALNGKYKWNNKTTIYVYFYVNMEENIFTYDIQSEGSTYYPYYNETNSEVNRVITENINTEIIKLIKKGILKAYENN